MPLSDGAAHSIKFGACRCARHGLGIQDGHRRLVQVAQEYLGGGAGRRLRDDALIRLGGTAIERASWYWLSPSGSRNSQGLCRVQEGWFAPRNALRGSVCTPDFPRKFVILD